MLFIDNKQLKDNLSVDECRKLMKNTLIKLSCGKAIEIQRQAIHLGDGNIFGLMPAYNMDDKIAGIKVITVFHDNVKKNLPSHQGIVSLFEIETGRPISILDGGSITAIRTAAVSAAVTETLSKKSSKTMAILGAGVQAREHIIAISKIRDIEEIRVWSRNYDGVKKFVKQMMNEVNLKIVASISVEEAVKNADIICTVTPSTTPILKYEWVSKGAHINAVGSCTPNARELDTELMVNGKIYVDRKKATLIEAGDYLIPFKQGILKEDDIIGEVGLVFTGEIKGRESDEEITIFEALGLAVEDISCAYFVYNKIMKEGL